MEQTVQTVLEVMQNEGLIQVEVSARHVHLCERSIKGIVRADAKLTPKRDLSQIGQYLSEESQSDRTERKKRQDSSSRTAAEGDPGGASKVTVSHWASSAPGPTVGRYERFRSDYDRRTPRYA